MAKKIKKRPISSEPIDPNLEEVTEDRAFEVELDDELNEIVFVHHYRRMWDDGFDADVEHGLNIEEAKALTGVMFSMIGMLEKKMQLEELQQKATIELVEKNPLKDNSVQ